MLFWKLALQWRGHVRVTSPRLLSAILDYQQTKGNSTCTASLYLYLLKWWIFTRYFVVAVVPIGRIGCHVIDCLRNNNPRILTWSWRLDLWGIRDVQEGFRMRFSRPRNGVWVWCVSCVYVCVCVCGVCLCLCLWVCTEISLHGRHHLTFKWP